MRRAELLGLTSDNVNHTNPTVRVIETLITIDGQPTTVPPKSRRSRRVIDLDDETASALRHRHTHQRWSNDCSSEACCSSS